jgi:hypothetical protein
MITICIACDIGIQGRRVQAQLFTWGPPILERLAESLGSKSCASPSTWLGQLHDAFTADGLVPGSFAVRLTSESKAVEVKAKERCSSYGQTPFGPARSAGTKWLILPTIMHQDTEYILVKARAEMLLHYGGKGWQN